MYMYIPFTDITHMDVFGFVNANFRKFYFCHWNIAILLEEVKQVD